MRTGVVTAGRSRRTPGLRPWRARLHGAVVVPAVLAVAVGFAPAASAAYAVEPVGPSWVPNAGVHAVVVDESVNRVYVGGSFTGGVAALTADTGELLWRGDANGDVRALALAPNGRLLVGGAFSTIDGFTHRKLAAVDAATGAVDNTIKPSVGGTVRDVVVVGSIAYFRGQFTNHDGFAQGGLGAFDLNNQPGRPQVHRPRPDGRLFSLDTDGAGALSSEANSPRWSGQLPNQLASGNFGFQPPQALVSGQGLPQLKHFWGPSV